MSMKFLSKKRWHVRRLENIKKVADAEAKMAEEQTRMAELRKEREEERELEAIRMMQEASGQVPKRQERLEFLYKAPPVPKKMEEEVVSSEAVLKNEEIDAKDVEARSQLPGGKWIGQRQRAKGDEGVQSREDPMTAIVVRRTRMTQEAEERRALLEKLRLEDEKRRSKKKHRSHK